MYCWMVEKLENNQSEMTKWSQANCKYYPIINLDCVCYVMPQLTTKIR